MSAPRRVRHAVVVDTAAVTPAMRRIVLGGPDVATLTVPAGALGPYVKLHFAACGGRDLVRTYSVRSYDARRGELHLDILLHGDDGPGSRFGAVARPGDAVRLGGPGFIPAEPCGSYLLAGDHTALPAIAHILESLPAHVRARAFIEVPGTSEEQDLRSAAAVEISWLHRPHGAPSRLADAVRAGWPDDRQDVLVWAGAEAVAARAIRAQARAVGHAAPGRCQVLNYWKAGQPEGGFSYVD